MSPYILIPDEFDTKTGLMFLGFVKGEASIYKNSLAFIRSASTFSIVVVPNECVVEFLYTTEPNQ